MRQEKLKGVANHSDARRLAAEGAKVVLHYHASAEGAEAKPPPILPVIRPRNPKNKAFTGRGVLVSKRSNLKIVGVLVC